MLFGCDFALYPEYRRNKAFTSAEASEPKLFLYCVSTAHCIGCRRQIRHWVRLQEPKRFSSFSSLFLSFKWLDVSEFTRSRLLRVEDRIVEINHGEILVAPVVLQIVGFPVGIRLFPGQQIDVRQERLLFERER